MNVKYWSVAALLAALILTGCDKKPHTYKDAEIDPEIRQTIRSLNEKVIKAIIDQDTASLLSFCSDRFIAQKRRKIVSHTGEVSRRLKSLPVETRNQFYLVNMDSAALTSVSTGTGEHDYSCVLRAPAKDMFIHVAMLKDAVQTLAFSLVYGKHGTDWKLDAIEFGLFALLDKDAIDWYQRSESFFAKGNYVDAVCNLTLSSRVLKPANDLMVYNKEKQIEEFRPVLEAEIAKMGKYPLEISYVRSLPAVFNIFPQLQGDVYCPTLWYKTNLSMTDTVTLSRECDAVHEKIGTKFTGLDLNNPYILYRAFDRVSLQGVGKSVSFKRKTSNTK